MTCRPRAPWRTAIRPRERGRRTPGPPTVERESGRIGHHRHHVLERDAFFAVGIERELAELAARGQPVAAEQRKERGAGVRRDGEPGRTHLVVDQPSRSARCRGSRARTAALLPSRRPRGSARSCAARRPRSRSGIPWAASPSTARPRRQSFGAGLHPDRAPAAEQRHRMSLLGEPRRLGCQQVAGKMHQRERIARIVDRGRMSFSTRSLTSPASGPNTSTIGRAG